MSESSHEEPTVLTPEQELANAKEQIRALAKENDKLTSRIVDLTEGTDSNSEMVTQLRRLAHDRYIRIMQLQQELELFGKSNKTHLAIRKRTVFVELPKFLFIIMLCIFVSIPLWVDMKSKVTVLSGVLLAILPISIVGLLILIHVHNKKYPE